MQIDREKLEKPSVFNVRLLFHSCVSLCNTQPVMYKCKMEKNLSSVCFRACSTNSSFPTHLKRRARCSTSKWKETTLDTCQRWPLGTQRRVSSLNEPLIYWKEKDRLSFHTASDNWSFVLWRYGGELSDGLPGCLRHQQEGNAANTPHPAGPSPQLLRLLLRNPQLARAGLLFG